MAEAGTPSDQLVCWRLFPIAEFPEGLRKQDLKLACFNKLATNTTAAPGLLQELPSYPCKGSTPPRKDETDDRESCIFQPSDFNPLPHGSENP